MPSEQDIDRKAKIVDAACDAITSFCDSVDPDPAARIAQLEAEVERWRVKWDKSGKADLEAEVERLRHIVTMQACPGTEGATDAE